MQVKLEILGIHLGGLGRSSPARLASCNTPLKITVPWNISVEEHHVEAEELRAEDYGVKEHIAHLRSK